MKPTDDPKPLDHNYDGIEEYDNPLPMWWLTTFFATIIFGYIYWIHYESGHAPTQAQELHADLNEIVLRKTQVAAPSGDSPDEAGLLATLATSKEALAAGRSTYQSKCAVCHGGAGEGGIGPCLTDNYWIHGRGQPEDIVKTVRQGVPDKGMPSWETMVSTDDLRAVSIFVASLRGTQPPNAKPPQGELIGPQ